MIIYKSANTITDIDDSQGIVKGLGSVFGNVDSDGDIMMKGAFTKSIQENSHRIKYLYQHRLDKPVGKMEELFEDSTGLNFVAKLALKTRLGKDVFEMIKAGVLTENSVGFQTIKQNYNKVEKVNRITEVKLYEISAVTVAANPLAFIEEAKEEDVVKEQLLQEYVTERFEALERLVKSNISDELGLAIEFEIKSLKELALNGFTEPQEHSDEEEANAKSDDVFNYLMKNLKAGNN
ncbi:MAG: HK97 family phage prohead protease, partial [Flavobacteriaceae bacterium]|nr:HK97 family phage prohead protease [Flavobacteriaceae bacterium]